MTMPRPEGNHLCSMLEPVCVHQLPELEALAAAPSVGMSGGLAEHMWGLSSQDGRTKPGSSIATDHVRLP